MIFFDVEASIDPPLAARATKNQKLIWGSLCKQLPLVRSLAAFPVPVPALCPLCPLCSQMGENQFFSPVLPLQVLPGAIICVFLSFSIQKHQFLQYSRNLGLPRTAQAKPSVRQRRAARTAWGSAWQPRAALGSLGQGMLGSQGQRRAAQGGVGQHGMA